MGLHVSQLKQENEKLEQEKKKLEHENEQQAVRYSKLHKYLENKGAVLILLCK